MKKIPSLFRRDYDGARLVYDEVVEGGEWVTAGEGRATVKIDGTCCRIHEGILWARYDRKRRRGATGEDGILAAYKSAPHGWERAQESPDRQTGHWPGWVPVGDGPEHRWHREGLEWLRDRDKIATEGAFIARGTYELVGPKVQGNPYQLAGHALWGHGQSFDLWRSPEPPREFDLLRAYLVRHLEHEGIVWWHPDGRMVKIKRRDFGLAWPPKPPEPA